jgi:Fe-S oxidoreductase
MRPSNELHIDNPMDPVKFEAVVRALGAEVVDYPTKLLCCGGTMNTAGLPDKAREMTREKLRELSGAVDVMSVVCPACFMQYDIAQLEMEREGHRYAVPVAVLSELMALAFGLPLDDLGLDLHRIPVQPALEKWSGGARLRATVAERIDLDAMQACVDCQACTRDCRVHKLDENYQPWAIFQKVLDGDIDGAISDPSIFQCVECYECSELCYQRWGMLKGLRELKHLAIERGLAPEAVNAGIEAFRSAGVLTPASASRRARLGLPPAPKPASEELQKLLGVEPVAQKPAPRKRKPKPDAG